MKRKFIFFGLLFITGITMAYSQNMPKKLFEQGYQYANGIDKPYDPAKAFNLFVTAADSGYAPAMNALGNLYLKGHGTNLDTKLAVDWFKKASKKGYANATFNLGRIYQKGEGVTQNFNEAAKYYRMGANAGDIQCKNELAYFYYKGLGVEQNYEQAFNLYLEIAKKGNVNAQYFVGLCYRNGYGTNANKLLAKEWLQKAAAKQDRQAVHELMQEPLPENRSTETPVLQEKVQSLKKYDEKFIAANTNNIEGEYQGYAVYYDFSKKYVHEIVPLKLVLKQKNKNYEGVWTESDSLTAKIKATLFNNNLCFDSSSKYIRNNYYSYRTQEQYLFNNAALQIKYINDSVYLSGDVKFYSLNRKEPGQPMYIVISKKINANTLHNEEELKLSINPNPATSFIKITLANNSSGNVQLELLSINGRVIQQIEKRTLPAGTYCYSLNVQKLTAGSYIIRYINNGTKKKEINKTFIKI